MINLTNFLFLTLFAFFYHLIFLFYVFKGDDVFVKLLTHTLVFVISLNRAYYDSENPPENVCVYCSCVFSQDSSTVVIISDAQRMFPVGSSDLYNMLVSFILPCLCFFRLNRDV